MNSASASIPDLYVPSTGQTPLVWFNREQNEITLRGRSIPEDVAGFYLPILQWLHAFCETNKQPLLVNIQLEYLNTHSTRALYDMLKVLEKHYRSGIDVGLVWFYEEDDEDMLNYGEDMANSAGLQVSIVELSEVQFEELLRNK